MKSPSHWSADLDIALIKTLRTCFSKSNTTSFAISSFEALLSSLCNAIETAQQRSRSHQTPIRVNSELEQTRDDQEQHQAIYDTNTADQGMETGFFFRDFFGTSDDSDTLAAMQFWPIDLGQSLDTSFNEYSHELDDYSADNIIT
jgi:hypothetical protein